MLGVEIWGEAFSGAVHMGPPYHAAQDGMLRAGIKGRTCAQPPFNPFPLQHPPPPLRTEAAKQRLKEEPDHSQPSQPATQQPALKRPRLASYESGDGSAPTGPSMLAYASLLGAATGNAAAAAEAAAAAAQAFAGALDPNVDPGMLAAAAAHEAAEAGATIEDAAAAAGAAAAVALHPVPLVKSSK